MGEWLVSIANLVRVPSNREIGEQIVVHNSQRLIHSSPFTHVVPLFVFELVPLR